MSCFSLLGTLYFTLDTKCRNYDAICGANRQPGIFNCWRHSVFAANAPTRLAIPDDDLWYGGRARALKSPSSATTMQGGNREGHAHYRLTTRSTTPGNLAPGEGKVNLHLRIDFDRLSVQQVGLVLPLLHGLDRGRCQHRMPADQLQVLNGAILADLRLQNYHALNTGLACQRRIYRGHFPNQKTRRNAGGNADARRSRHFRRCHRRAAQNAADYAAHGATRDATW